MTDHRLDRRDLLKATGAVAIGAGVATQTATAQSAEGHTVYVGLDYNKLYTVDAATGSQEWAFTQPSFSMHGKTVADLLTELEDVREEWKRALDQQLREMTDRLDGLV